MEIVDKGAPIQGSSFLIIINCSQPDPTTDYLARSHCPPKRSPIPAPSLAQFGSQAPEMTGEKVIR